MRNGWSAGNRCEHVALCFYRFCLWLPKDTCLEFIGICECIVKWRDVRGEVLILEGRLFSTTWPLILDSETVRRQDNTSPMPRDNWIFIKITLFSFVASCLPLATLFFTTTSLSIKSRRHSKCSKTKFNVQVIW